MQRVKVLVREGDSRLAQGFREQILWEHEGRFVVTSRIVGGPYRLDETMAFPANEDGSFIDYCELASADGIGCHHEHLARIAFDSPYFR